MAALCWQWLWHDGTSSATWAFWTIEQSCQLGQPSGRFLGPLGWVPGTGWQLAASLGQWGGEGGLPQPRCRRELAYTGPTLPHQLGAPSVPFLRSPPKACLHQAGDSGEALQVTVSSPKMKQR